MRAVDAIGPSEVSQLGFTVAGMDPEDYAMLEALVRHGRRRQIDQFLLQGDGCGWCRHPIRLRGHVVSTGTGECRISFSSASLPDGVFLKACGTRSEVRCPACAAVYRGDACHLVRSGLEGGKGVPESVAEHPAVFLTLTAPGFGAVHSVRSAGGCHDGRLRSRCVHARSTICRQRHGPSDELVGTPLCPECYDYVGAVLQNACTPELWRRTMIYLARQLATALGVSQAESTKLLRISFCRVAEFQRRGVVHLHAIVRADGPNGSLPPLRVEDLGGACGEAARAASVSHARGAARWGNEMDVQVLGRDNDRAAQVAIYVAKYATKSSSDDPRLDAPIASLEDVEARHLPAHLHRMVVIALELDTDPELGCLNLARHAHRLGFGGHFLTKSRGYSTTFKALREARALWSEARRYGGQVPDDHTTEGHWKAVGAGWANSGEALFARHQQRQRAEDRREVMLDWYTRSE
jgi:uncharacterized Zn-finger protein